MNMPNQILVRALEIVESGWTQGAFARDCARKLVFIYSPQACAWCAGGATQLAASNLRASDEDSDEAWAAMRRFMGFEIAVFNDSHTKAEVVAAFKDAIEATK